MTMQGGSKEVKNDASVEFYEASEEKERKGIV